MVRHHSNQYRSQPIPETPLTPRTPRSPHVHRERLFTPSLSIRRSPGLKSSSSSPSTDLLVLSLSRKRQLNLGNKSNSSTRNNNNNNNNSDSNSDIEDTPSVALSMNLNVLALGGSTPATRSPSSRLSDDAIHIRNLSLPFERIPSSPSPTPSKHGEVPHRYPTRTSHLTTERQEGQAELVSPPRPKTDLKHLSTPPRLSNATTTHFSSPRQFMTDEANNLFLATSPKAIRNRTPRNNTPKTMENPVPSPFLLQTLESSRSSPTEEVMPAKKEEEDGAQDEEDETMEDYDDESIETASTHSSLIDHEKENTTPKFIEDHINPFLVGGTSALLDMKRAARGQGKSDIMSTPSGPSDPSGSSSSSSSQGVVRRSKRLALDSLSPWRWNLEEQYGLPPTPYSKNGKGQGSPFIEGCGGPITKYTGQNAVSDWIETTSNRSSSPTPESSSSTGGAGSSTQRNRLSNGWTTGSSSSSSSSSSSPSIAGPSSSKGAQIRIPDHHPNSFSSEHRQPSATVAKVTQKIIQPASLAFNRRAQQVAGRIYYWKNGGYHLVNEQDKQQWPGEWKFDVYQDPESPDAVSTTFANNNAGASMPIPSSTSYLGKGKLTDRQLSGPASKRRRLQRESSSGLDSSPSGRDMDIQKSMTPPPSHPTSPAPGNKTPRPQGKLQDRYDFRERRMLNSPLSTPSRRSMA